jgi:transposase
MLTSDYNEILLDLKDVFVTKVTTTESTVSIFLENPRKPHSCPTCSTVTDSIHDYRSQSIKEIPILGKTAILVLRKRRYVCSSCRKRFFEKNVFLERYQRMTNRLKRFLISLFAINRSATSIAQECRCSVSTALKYFETVSYPKPKLTPVISIDEFKGNAGGHKFQCSLSDPAERKLLDILPSRKAEDLYDYFTSFPMEERLKVKYVVMDLSSLFSSVIRQCFPSARIVADKFHVCRLANWALESIRKEEQKKFAQYRRIYFKKSRWILLTRNFKLKDEEKLQLNHMLNISEPLHRAYSLKEEFYEMINMPTFKERVAKWKDWQDSVLQANLPSFNKFMKTVIKWSSEILVSAETGYSNGFTEGCNNRIKVLKRVCYGVRNFNRFRNRILYMVNS